MKGQNWAINVNEFSYLMEKSLKASLIIEYLIIYWINTWNNSFMYFFPVSWLQEKTSLMNE